MGTAFRFMPDISGQAGALPTLWRVVKISTKRPDPPEIADVAGNIRFIAVDQGPTYTITVEHNDQRKTFEFALGSFVEVAEVADRMPTKPDDTPFLFDVSDTPVTRMVDEKYMTASKRLAEIVQTYIEDENATIAGLRSALYAYGRAVKPSSILARG